LLTSLVFNNGFIDFDTTGPIIFFAVVIIGTHLRILVKARGRYNTTPIVGQEIFWMMDDNGIERKNDSFFSQVGWNTIYKIKNDEKWVLIYANKASVTYFPKELISDEELREIKKAFFIAKKTLPPVKIN
jgi:hypothetical protein